jgi:hypothetical protein
MLLGQITAPAGPPQGQGLEPTGNGIRNSATRQYPSGECLGIELDTVRADQDAVAECREVLVQTPRLKCCIRTVN